MGEVLLYPPMTDILGHIFIKELKICQTTDIFN